MNVRNDSKVHFQLLSSSKWDDYELIDTGHGKKFERFGAYRVVRPETQAIWTPTLSLEEWNKAEALFERGKGDDGPGTWKKTRSLPDQWLVRYDNLAFWVRLTPFRHTGIFPEHGSHWEWVRRQLAHIDRQPNVLVLFGYTGCTTLVAAQVGARVCHVDASRPAISWARDNQAASELTHAPIRWIVDDVLAFVGREVRRGSRYDMIIMDPPVFGRGPKGQIWRLQESLHTLVMTCRQLLSDQAVGMLVNAYATTFSALTLYNILAEAVGSLSGEVKAGELVMSDSAAARSLSTALYACWSRQFSR